MTDLPEKTEFPQHLKKFNWGAFILTWIWGLGNKYYKALLILIPVFGTIILIPYAFYLGFNGNKIAWNNSEENDEEKFTKNQKNWAIAGVVTFIISLILLILPLVYLAKVGLDVIGNLNKDIIIPFVEKTYNSGNYTPFCKGQKNEKDCFEQFKNIKKEYGKITKLEPIDSNVNSKDGVLIIELLDKGDFEKGGKNIFINAKITQKDGKYQLVGASFEI